MDWQHTELIHELERSLILTEIGKPLQIKTNLINLNSTVMIG